MRKIYREIAALSMESFWERYNSLPECRDLLYYKGRYGRKAYERFLKDISFVCVAAGSEISQATEEMVARSEKYQVRTYTYFNGVYLTAEPGKETAESLVEVYHQRRREDWEKYQKTFRYKLFERKMEAEEEDAEKRRKIVDGWMEEEKMKIRFFKFFKYRKAKKINSSNSYSNRIVTYAHQWAVGMQRDLREGKKLEEVADEVSKFVNYDDITGFMYGCAAGFIAHFWKHGKEFRKWFNLYNQIGDEGEKANKKRNRILNPAILSVSLGGD
jgi:hypothetical protein